MKGNWGHVTCEPAATNRWKLTSPAGKQSFCFTVMKKMCSMAIFIAPAWRWILWDGETSPGDTGKVTCEKCPTLSVTLYHCCFLCPHLQHVCKCLFNIYFTKTWIHTWSSHFQWGRHVQPLPMCPSTVEVALHVMPNVAAVATTLLFGSCWQQASFHLFLYSSSVIRHCLEKTPGGYLLLLLKQQQIKIHSPFKIVSTNV